MSRSIAFADSETRSPIDVTQVGAYKYAAHPETEALVWSWAIDDGEPRIWSPDWAWSGNCHDLSELYLHIRDGGYFVAWNAYFDRWIWNRVMVEKYAAPYLPLEQVLCAQAQAEANNLPGKLEKAAECLQVDHKKDPQGARLIKLLSVGCRADWEPEHGIAERMGRFRRYCASDVLAMRDIWQCTRPLMQNEWREYHASERVNDRGVMVDVDFAEAARDYAQAEAADINGQLATVTDDPRMTLSHHARKAAWLYEQLWPSEELQEVCTKPPKEKDGPTRKSCDRPTREAVLELLSQPGYADLFHVEHRDRIIEFLELIEAGNSSAVRKFDAICRMEVGGRVYGQYSFNGAGQTGRFSSRGIQIHNLIRAPLVKGEPDAALDAMELILGGEAPDKLEGRYGLPLSRLLARLIRPTFIAKDGHTLIWADYDQIEGRTLPWLAGTPGAELKLDLYRKGIDTYKVAAAEIFGVDYTQIGDDSSERQIGKVAELALGFGGAVGAFSAMGRGYGVHVRESDAKRIVELWRAANQWVVEFWDVLWQAAIGAYKSPGVWHSAGRVRYIYQPQIMHGTLICQLPSGRWLVYPQFRHERIEEEDERGRLVTRVVTTFVRSFGSGHGRIPLWYGMLAENITQATAADLLRNALVSVDDIAVLHTHDEIVCEVRTGTKKAGSNQLRAAMTEIPDWAAGLPATVSVDSGPYYTK